MKSEEFKSIRKELDRTQEELSHQLGVTARTISRYETGKYPIPWWISDRMEDSRIKDKTKIVYDPGMVTLEELINSYDQTKCVYIETESGSFTVIVTAQILKDKVVVTNYMQGIYPNQIGRYINDGVWTESKGIELTDDMIYTHLQDAFIGRVNYASVHGISFEYAIKKPI
jgi:DNA-binding XRE family transcriptional regulator